MSFSRKKRRAGEWQLPSGCDAENPQPEQVARPGSLPRPRSVACGSVGSDGGGRASGMASRLEAIRREFRLNQEYAVSAKLCIAGTPSRNGSESSQALKPGNNWSLARAAGSADQWPEDSRAQGRWPPRNQYIHCDDAFNAVLKELGQQGTSSVNSDSCEEEELGERDVRRGSF